MAPKNVTRMGDKVVKKSLGVRSKIGLITSGRISKGSLRFVRGRRCSLRGSQQLNGVVTRSRGGHVYDAMSFRLPGFKKRKSTRRLPGIRLWAPLIPQQSCLRAEKFRLISSTILWPDVSTLNAEASLFSHYVSYASDISGWAHLSKKRILNSKHGAIYECIVRYKDRYHRQASLAQHRSNRPVYHYLAQRNVSVSSASIDIRYYMTRYNLPLSILVGEGHAWSEFPHCTCLILRYYDNVWQAVIKESLNEDKKVVGPTTKALLHSLGFNVAYFLPLSEKESTRHSINCVGHAIQAASTVMDGKMEELVASVPKTAIYKYDLNSNQFMDNHLEGIPIVKEFMPALQTVRMIDSLEIRSRLNGFRQRATKAGAELWKTISSDESEI